MVFHIWTMYGWLIALGVVALLLYLFYWLVKKAVKDAIKEMKKNELNM